MFNKIFTLFINITLFITIAQCKTNIVLLHKIISMAKKKTKEYPVIAIRISEAFKNKVESEAKKNKRSVSDYCRIILEEKIFK